MSGPARNQDKINTIGVVVVGICGAVLVYVSITALEAFYVNDTSEIQTMADYGGQDVTAKSVKADQLSHIGEYGANAAGAAQTYHLKIDRAMQLVVDNAKVDPGSLVPAFGRSDKSTIDPVFGRPKIAPPAPAPAPGGATPPATPTNEGSGAGSAAPAPAAGSGAGSAAVVIPPAAPMVPTGAAPAKGTPQLTPNPARPRPKANGSGGHAP